jgi:hypothetical protein
MTTQPARPAEGRLDLRTMLLNTAAPHAADAPDRALLAPELVDAALGSVPGLGAHGRRVLVDNLVRVTESFLGVDVAGAALRGWRLHEQLLAAARSTVNMRGLTEIVDLTSHDVSAAWHPSIDVLVGPTRVARLTVNVTVTLHMVGMFATVSLGRLTRVGGGRCDVTARVAMNAQPLLDRTVAISAELVSTALGRGIPLLAADPDAAA